jgi:hypothetical protein
MSVDWILLVETVIMKKDNTIAVSALTMKQ